MSRSSDKTGVVLLIAGVVVLIPVLLAASFGLTWLGIEWRGFFGPKRQAVEREIFEQSPSYIHGKIQDLARYRHEYMTAETDEQRDAIASTVRLQFAQFDVRSLDQRELHEFWLQCNR